LSGPARSLRLRRDLRAIVGDGVAYSAMVGLGETYVAAFALAIGLGDVVAALVSTLPVLVGAVLQLAGPAAVRWMGSHRRWVIACAGAQVLALLPLIGGALVGRIPIALLFASVAVYWAGGFSAGTAWNSWMVAIVPARLRARYFARRARLAQVSLFLSLVGGGALLHASAGAGHALAGFATAFALAGVARLVSAWMIARQSDVAPEAAPAGRERVRDAAAALGRSRALPLLGYLLCAQLASHVASPFFTPYMLERLTLSYGEYVGLTGASFLARIAVLPLLGRMAQRRGARALLKLGGVCIVPLPILWNVSSELPYLFAVQLFAGAAWSAYELAVMLLFFEALDRETRLGLLALYNLGNALCMLGGSLIGAFILRHAGADGAAYEWVFAISTLARLAALALLRRVPHVDVRRAPIPTRQAAVRPSLGAIQPPVVAALPSRNPARAEPGSGSR
jgi:hypothetical protein